MPHARSQVSLDVRATYATRGHAAALRAAVEGQLLGKYAGSEVVLVRLTLPREREGVRLEKSTREAIGADHPPLRAAMREFARECPELTDRSKRKKRECTNVC